MCLVQRWVLLLLLVGVAWPSDAAVVRSSEPFLGVTHHQIVQRPGNTTEPALPGSFAAQLFEIEMNAPGLDFLLSPPADPNGSPAPLDSSWTIPQTTRSFVNQVGAQMGINGDFYGTAGGFTQPIYTNVSDGVPYGLFFSGSYLNITDDNDANIWSSGSEMFNAGVDYWNAIGGNQRILTNGQITAPLDSSYTTTLNPHTAVGVSADRERLFLLTVDGRQPSYSSGIRTDDMAELMRWFGAHDAINLDGGGSTTMVMDDTDDGLANAQVINTPSDGGGGVERRVGNSLAVFATPNPDYVPLGNIRDPWGDPRPTYDQTTLLAGFDDPTIDALRFDLTPRATTNATASASIAAGAGVRGGDALRLEIEGGDEAGTWTRVSLGTDELDDADDLEREAMKPEGVIAAWVRAEGDPETSSSSAIQITLTLNDGTPLLGTSVETIFEAVPTDGQWHQIEWRLDTGRPTPQTVRGPNVLLESLNVSSSVNPTGRGAVPWTGRVWIDTLAYGPDSTPVFPTIPEPNAALALLICAALARRRAIGCGDY